MNLFVFMYMISRHIHDDDDIWVYYWYCVMICFVYISSLMYVCRYICRRTNFIVDESRSK